MPDILREQDFYAIQHLVTAVSSFSLKHTRVPILASFGMWNVWSKELFGEDKLCCHDPLYRAYERHFRMMIFQHDIGDDFIFDP